MRKLFITSTALLTAIIFFSCSSPMELTKQDSESVFSHNIELKKNDLKLKIVSFLNESFRNAKMVIQSNEDGLITGNYTYFIKNFDILGVVKIIGMNTFMIKYDDNSYKTKLLIKSIIYRDDKGDTEPDVSYWGNYKEEIKTSFVSFDNQLKKYLETDQNF